MSGMLEIFASGIRCNRSAVRKSYTKAKEVMLFYTDTADAPWTIIRSDDKNHARLAAMKFVLNSIPHDGKDTTVGMRRIRKSSVSQGYLRDG